MEEHVLVGKRIVVAGAGIAGMAFARALERSWPVKHPIPEVVLYERSAKKLEPSREGYTLGIRSDRSSGGLQAIQKLGLLDVALQYSTTGVVGLRPTIWNKNWQPMLKLPGGGTPPDGLPVDRIRIVRHHLRQMLLDGLPSSSTVHWEVGCESARILDQGKIEISLSNGTTDECDLLIAADGANSKLRSCLLPHAKLDFAGAIFINGTSKFPAGKPSLLKDDWGQNISGEGVAFLNFPVDNTTGVWALTYRTDQPRRVIRGKEAIERKDEILDEIKQRGKMFKEPFRQFIEATDPTTLSVYSAMQKSPMNHARELPQANIIFIGDANHAMSPFSGNGASMALMDAVELAKQLSTCVSVRSAIENFDAESAPRSQKAIDWSRWVIRLLHLKGLPFLLFRGFLGVMQFFFGKKS